MYVLYQISVRQATISLSLLLAYTSRYKPWESLWSSSATTPLVDFHHRLTACPSYLETCAARRTSTKKSPDITPRLFFFHILVICTIILYSWHWSGSKSIYSPVYNNLFLASRVKNCILNGFFFYQNSCYIKRNQLISSRQCIYLCRKARI